MKSLLLRLSCVGLLCSLVACDSSEGDSNKGADGSASGGATNMGAGGAGNRGGNAAAGASGSGGVGVGGTGGPGAAGTGGGTIGTGPCATPIPVGSCFVPTNSPPAASCTEFYSGTVTAATIKTICDGSKGMTATTGCPKANLLGFCNTSAISGGVPILNSYYYGTPSSGDPYKNGCMSGGGTWCDGK